MATAYSSTSTTNGCPPGFVDDNWMVFTAIPCGMSAKAHIVLCVCWAVSMLLIGSMMFINMHRGVNKLKILPVHMRVLLATFVTFSFVFEIYSISRPGLANLSNVVDRAVLATLFTINSSAIMCLIVAFGSHLIAAVSTSLSPSYRKSTRRVIGRQFQFISVSLQVIVAVVFLNILPQVIVDPVKQQLFVDVFLYCTGIILCSQCLVIIYFFEKIRAQVLERLKMAQATNNQIDQEESAKLASRARVINVMIFFGGVLIFPAVWILVGAVIQTRYIVVHLLIGPAELFILLIAACIIQSPYLHFLWSKSYFITSGIFLISFISANGTDEEIIAAPPPKSPPPHIPFSSDKTPVVSI